MWTTNKDNHNRKKGSKMADDIYEGDLQEDCCRDSVDGAYVSHGGAYISHGTYVSHGAYVPPLRREHISDSDLYETGCHADISEEYGCSSMVSGYHSDIIDPGVADSYQNEQSGGASWPEERSLDTTDSQSGSGVEGCTRNIRKLRLNSTGSNRSQRDSAIFLSSGFGSMGDEQNNNDISDSPAEVEEVAPQHNENLGSVHWDPQSYRDEDGDTDLHIAITQHREDVVGELLSYNLPPGYVNLPDAYGRTALHLAILTDQPELLRPLLQSQADPCARDHCGDTPLHTACHEGLLSCVRTIVSLISLLYPSTAYDCNSRNYQGFTCLHLAAANGHKEVVSFLLKHLNIDINAGDGCSGRTVLHHAADRGDKLLVYYLLNKYSDRLNINALAHDRRTTPLTLAKGREHMDIVKVLEAGGAIRWVDCELQTSDSSDSDCEMCY